MIVFKFNQLAKIRFFCVKSKYNLDLFRKKIVLMIG